MQILLLLLHTKKKVQNSDAFILKDWVVGVDLTCERERKVLADADTLKNVMVAPSSTTPYRILVCLARSSAESMGDSILSTVRKAAKFAVYEEMMMRVKNHQMPPTIRVDSALGMSSEPGGWEAAKVNVTLQNVFTWATPCYDSNLVFNRKLYFYDVKHKISSLRTCFKNSRQGSSWGSCGTRIKMKSLQRALKTRWLLDFK